MDQAGTLRRIMQNRRTTGIATRQGPPVFTVSSGKGGVGKSSFVANIGAILAREGLRVLLVDSDAGLANLDILLNVTPSATLEDVFSGKASIQEAVVGVEHNLWLVPASSGFLDAREASPERRKSLIELFETFPWEMDLILVDIGAGIQDNVLSLHHPCFSSIVMLTPEPTSFTDAYGLIKLLRRESRIDRIQIVVNQVTDGREGQQVFQKLKGVTAKFLDVELEYLGHWEEDEKVTRAVMKRTILLDLPEVQPTKYKEEASSIRSLKLLAKRLRASSQVTAPADDKNLLSESRSRLRTAKFSARYQEDPAQVSAPGNIAEFWRTLLGEVKA